MLIENERVDMKLHHLIFTLRFCLLWNLIPADDSNRPKAKKTVTLTYYPFDSDFQSHVRLYKVTNPALPKYEYLGAQYAAPEVEQGAVKVMHFEKVPESPIYEFREFSYDADGAVKKVVVYHDFSLVELPPVKFLSGKAEKSLQAQFDFQNEDVSIYMWSLYDVSAPAQPIRATQNLILGMRLERFYISDNQPIIPLVLLLLCMFTAIAVRIYRRARKADGSRSGKSGPGKVSEVNASGVISGGVRKWDAYIGLPCHPVPVDEFERYVEEISENLEEQYNESRAVGTNASVSFAQKYPNDNRYLNIIPYNHSRVHLYPQSSGPLPKNIPAPKYINASYVPGELRIREYIATQGPKKDTMLAFWAMVVQTEAVVIVMLTNLKERDPAGKMRPKCTQYWPKEGAQLKLTDQFVIENKREEEKGKGSYVIRDLTIKFMDREIQVTQFHYLAWPDHGVPARLREIVNFIEQSHNFCTKSASSVIVHCSAGVGRTGCYIILCRLKDQLANKPAEIDLQRMTSESRFCRMEMVQTLGQYRFLHDVAIFMLNKYGVTSRANREDADNFEEKRDQPAERTRNEPENNSMGKKKLPRQSAPF